MQLQDLETGDFLRSDAKDGKQGTAIQRMKHDKYLQKKVGLFSEVDYMDLLHLGCWRTEN